MNQLVNNYANMNISNSNINANVVSTPQSSPSLQHFSTPTTTTDVGDLKARTQVFNQSANLSPISAAGFTHSATSHFSNVKQLQEPPHPIPSQQPQNQPPQVPSTAPIRNGSGVAHQNSLPSSNAQPSIRPPLQPSLSQPRMMTYNYNPAMQTTPVNHTPPTISQPNNQMNGYNQNQNYQNVRGPMPLPAMTLQAQPQLPPQLSGVQPQYQHQPSANTTQIRPALQPQSSSPNLFNQQRPGMPPPPMQKSNSLSGPAPENYNISNKAGLHVNRYPQQAPPAPQQQQQQFNANPNVQSRNFYQQPQQQQQFTPQPQMQQIPLNQYQQPQQQQQYQSTVQSGFNRLWGADNFDLLQTPTILPPTKVEAPRVALGNTSLDEANCSPDIFRCTVTKIPESNALLQKSRLPLGILIHPFRDLNHLPVIQCNTIVRCRACRTYINPFVFFVDSKRWKCNLCYRVNELPEEFQYDPVTKTYGDPSRRPEVKSSTIEYIAPAEYMLRPPQPAIYLFLLDISRAAVESGYLQTVCATLSAEIANLPGDARTHIGFIAYDSALHFYSLADGLSQPHEMTVLDIDDIFLPCPDNLLVNLQDRMDLIQDLLTQLPQRYNNSYDTGSALGAALQAGHKMMASTGGRITVFQSSLPTMGPGALTAREDPSNRASGEVLHLNPANDFYKRLALECSGQQIAVDLFILNSQYVDIATISGICRFSGGCMYHFPLFKASRELQNGAFEKSLKRYLTRKIGFEAVMRIRCTRGLSIHTFHGNFFVRSTDLLSLPNVNPDAGYGMQVAIEENLSDVQNICFQAALLYTSSKGERRIRVHTLCLPVVSTLSDVINSADQQCIVGLLAKMAVDRSMQSSLADAREAFINVAIDILSSYKLSQNMAGNTSLIVPRCLRLLPLYISALLKHPAFRSGISTRLDDRVKSMCDMKTRPLQYLIQQIYPDLYPVHNLQDQITVLNDEEEPVHMPPILQLSARSIDSTGAYLFDMCDHMILVVCQGVNRLFLNQALGVADYNAITDSMCELPVLDNEHNQRLHMFINYLNEEKPMCATLQIIRENSPLRGVFLERLVEDRVETALSYHEFLQHLKTQVK